MRPLIAPSILSADFSDLKKDIEMINHSKADWFHVDVMDGMFVPNISFGFPVIKAIRKYAQKPLDVHLMIVDPDRYLAQFRDAGADILTVHFEACPHLHRTLDAIKKLGMKAGIAINPHTPAEALRDIIQEADLVCVMSVNPGFGGQRFIENTYRKVRHLKELIHTNLSTAKIEVDGGVDLVNCDLLIEAGTDVLVAGNTVFSAPDPARAIAELKKNEVPI